MAIRLSDIAGAVASGMVKIKGKDYPIRAINAAESKALRSAFLRPTPPFEVPAHKGSKAEPEYNDGNQAYRARLNEWLIDLTHLEIAVGLGWESANGKAFDAGLASPAVEDWGRLVLSEIRSQLTDDELAAIANVQKSLSVGTVERALGN